MAKKRSIKVYGQGGYQHKDTPTIMLKGKWLEELGFQFGDYISVNCEDGKLVITLDAERVALEETKKEFMEKELKALEHKYQLEKKKMLDRFVAEKEAGYGSWEE